MLFIYLPWGQVYPKELAMQNDGCWPTPQTLWKARDALVSKSTSLHVVFRLTVSTTWATLCNISMGHTPVIYEELTLDLKKKIVHP